MAETISLAVLENLVHMSRQDFPTGYVSIAATIPDHVAMLTAEVLPSRFTNRDPRELGDRWLSSMHSAVLRVPSAVVPSESNYLLNPRHPGIR